MSIQATRKTGFLIEDGILLGKVIGLLRYDLGSDEARIAASALDAIRAKSYYEPVQPLLIDVSEIEEVTA